MALAQLRHLLPLSSAPPPGGEKQAQFQLRYVLMKISHIDVHVVMSHGSDLFSVLQLLLLALWHEVVQPAHLSLSKDAVH